MPILSLIHILLDDDRHDDQTLVPFVEGLIGIFDAGVNPLAVLIESSLAEFGHLLYGGGGIFPCLLYTSQAPFLFHLLEFHNAIV